jgi:hypothetical protein
MVTNVSDETTSSFLSIGGPQSGDISFIKEALTSLTSNILVTISSTFPFDTFDDDCYKQPLERCKEDIFICRLLISETQNNEA